MVGCNPQKPSVTAALLPLGAFCASVLSRVFGRNESAAWKKTVAAMLLIAHRKQPVIAS